MPQGIRPQCATALVSVQQRCRPGEHDSRPAMTVTDATKFDSCLTLVWSRCTLGQDALQSFVPAIVS